MKMVAQVVQHLIPGGIETMALDLAAFCEDHEETNHYQPRGGSPVRRQGLAAPASRCRQADLSR